MKISDTFWKNPDWLTPGVLARFPPQYKLGLRILYHAGSDPENFCAKKSCWVKNLLSYKRSTLLFFQKFRFSRGPRILWNFMIFYQFFDFGVTVIPSFFTEYPPNFFKIQVFIKDSSYKLINFKDYSSKIVATNW